MAICLSHVYVLILPPPLTLPSSLFSFEVVDVLLRLRELSGVYPDPVRPEFIVQGGGMDMVSLKVETSRLCALQPVR